MVADRGVLEQLKPSLYENIMLAPQRDRLRVRILRGRAGVPAGAGVLVGDPRITTCAPVASIALSREQRHRDIADDNADSAVGFPMPDGTDAATPRACLDAASRHWP
jgi:hypothetical protein